jgi:geranylgeranyl diphosphate synthase, type I
MTVTSGAPEALNRGQEAVRPLLRKALSRLDGDCGTIAAYHLGFTDLDGTPTESAGGKAVRPALAVLSARAAGGDADAGLPGAVAVELVHNFSLVHDDLMDGDTLRRHRPTVWSVWGSATAILVGDALLALAHEMLLEEATAPAARAAALLSDATRRLIRGQMADLAFEHRDDVTVPECLRMCADKTGALLSASAAIGAVLAGAPKATIDALAEFGAQLGLAFQMVDDLLGIWGDPAATGKPVFSDLRSRKKSLPVCYAVNNPAAAGRELARWLGGTPPPEGDAEPALARAAALVDDAGGRDWAIAEARRCVAAGQHALGAAPLDNEVRAELIDIAHFIVDRKM